MLVKGVPGVVEQVTVDPILIVCPYGQILHNDASLVVNYGISNTIVLEIL